VIYHSLDDGKQEHASLKAAVGTGGRDPTRVHVAPACYVCVGESEAVAQEKRAAIEATARDVDALVLLSEVLNYDFAENRSMSRSATKNWLSHPFRAFVTG
jgi:alkanesulfonate monooxygenase SsuD/methylene tetrahydromethanopterin reductase-like flavin-dependent oxidoreductase (luciferase family)